MNDLAATKRAGRLRRSRRPHRDGTWRHRRESSGQIVARRRPTHRGAGVRFGAAEVIVEGRVQGVGYRNFAHRRAQEWGLTGYAVNLRSGHVKIRVEGARESIEGYVRDLEKGPPLARVERVSVTSVPYSGEYREFSIRFWEAR